MLFLPASPLRSPERLAALADLGLLHRPSRAIWDRLTRLGARVLNSPMTAITVITGERQVFLSHHGLREPLASDRLTSIESSFCQHVVRSTEPLVVEDAPRHALVRDSPLIEQYGIVAYAGWPWRTIDGHVQGAFCAMDTVPREWTPEELDVLRDLADAVTDTVAMRPPAPRAAALPTPTAEVLLDNIGDMAWLKDSSSRYVAVNEAFARGVGRRPDQVAGYTDADLFCAETAAAARTGDLQVMGSGDPRVFLDSIRMPDGSVRWLEKVKTPLRDELGDVTGTVGVARDVTERRRTEERESILAESGAIVSAPMDEKDRLRDMAGLMVPRLADWCVIDILHEDGGLSGVKIAAADRRRDEILHAMLELYPHHTTPNGSVVDTALQGREPVLLAEVTPDMIRRNAQSERHLEMLTELAPASSMIVPLVTHGRTVGVMTLSAGHARRRYDETDLALATEVGRRLAMAMQNARLYRRAREARDRVTRLQQVTSAFSEALTPENVAAVAVAQGAAAIGAASGSLIVFDESGTGFDVLHAERCPEDLHAAWRLLPDETAGELVESVRGGSALFFESRAQWEALHPGLEPSGVPNASGAVVPLLEQGRAAGALVFGFDEWRAFSTRDRELIQSIGRQAALALERTRLYEAEQRAVAARDEILGVVAHDLRNPLSAIDMYAHLIDESLPRDHHARVHGQAIRALSDQANRLIQDLLDVTRIEAGRLWVEPLPVSAEALVNPAVEMLRLQAEAEDIEMEKRIDGNAPRVWADPARVGQVLSNLLGNALKFTEPKGRIVVSAEAKEAEVVFTIADDGAGIAPEHLEHLFDRFWQARGARRTGVGLGLSIAKGIVEAHRGRIWAESEPGRGTTIYFTLPVATPAPG